MNIIGLHWWSVSIGSGNGLVPSGNVEPMLTQISVALTASLGHNKLTHGSLVMPYGEIDLGQHWLRWWLVAWQHQAITWTNVYFSLARSSDNHLMAWTIRPWFCKWHFWQSLIRRKVLYFDSNFTLKLMNLIKSPQYTGGDFMFLYRFVRRRRRPQILVHAITFEQLFGFLSFLAQLLALTCRLPD